MIYRYYFGIDRKIKLSRTQNKKIEFNIVITCYYSLKFMYSYNLNWKLLNKRTAVN